MTNNDLMEVSKENEMIAKLSNIPLSLTSFKLRCPLLFSSLEISNITLKKDILKTIDKMIQELENIMSFQSWADNDTDLKEYLNDVEEFFLTK